MKARTALTASFGPYEIDVRLGQIKKCGIKLKMGEQPFQILLLLIATPGELVTRDELRTKLWPGDTFVDFDHGMNSAVQRLRDCLSDTAAKPRWIETVPRRGYRFVGEVEWNVAPSQAHENASEKPVQLEIKVRNSAGPSRGLWARLSLTVVAGVLAIAIVLLAALYVTPLPSPKIVSTAQLTSDGLEKLPSVLTDGTKIYFTEHLGDRWKVRAVPVTGGEVVSIDTPFPNTVLINNSPDHFNLLVGEGTPIQDVPLWILPAAGGPPQRLANVIAHSAAWSPDGKNIAYCNEGNLYLARFDGTQAHKVSLESDPGTWAWTPTWSSDSKRLRFERYAMEKHASSIWEYVEGRGSARKLFARSETIPTQCCGVWTRDQKYYVFDSWRDLEAGVPTAPAANLWAVREPMRWFRSRSEQATQLTAGPMHFFTHTISSDGKTIFALSTQRRGELTRYDVKTQRFLPYLEGISADNVSFSNDGQWMAYVKYPQGELWRSRADGTEPLQLTLRPLMASVPRWSPDGKRIAFCGQQVGTLRRTYIVSANGITQPLEPLRAEGTDPTWSPDGTSILLDEGMQNAGFKIVHLQTNAIEQVPGSGGLTSPRWSPDGHYISAVSNTGDHLMLFDFKTKQWTQQSHMDAIWQNWSRDGKYLYFASLAPEPGIFRIATAGNKLTTVISLKGFRQADPNGAWFSLDKNDAPLLLRDVGGWNRNICATLGRALAEMPAANSTNTHASGNGASMGQRFLLRRLG